MATIGVTVTTGTIGPSGQRAIAYSNLFAAVQSPWGEDGVVKICDSFNSFVRNFGGLNKMTTIGSGTTNDTTTYETDASVVQGYYAVKAYFDEKGTNGPGVAYVARVVDSTTGGTAGSKTFTDGSGNNTTITAKWKGSWGNAIRITVTNSSPRKGSGYALIKAEAKIGSQSFITEFWDIGNATDAANVSRKSELITITLPAGGQLPQTAAEAKLNSGTPGTADSYGASDADLVGTTSAANVRTGIQVFNDPRLGSGMVIIPGKYTSTIRNGIKTHAEAYDRMGFIGTATGFTLSTIATELQSLTSNNMAFFWPPLELSDQNSDAGGSILVDPCGHLAGLQARMDGEYRGPHKGPAGILHPFRTVLNVESQSNGDELVSDSGSNTLDDSFINTIRRKGNPTGIVSWGNNTLAQDNRYRQINASRTVMVVRQTLLLMMEKFTHEPIDSKGQLFAKVSSDAIAFLDSLYSVGALFGDRPGKDPKPTDAYVVICDRSNNTDLTIGANELHLDIGIIPTPNVRQIMIQLFVAAPGFNKPVL